MWECFTAARDLKKNTGARFVFLENRCTRSMFNAPVIQCIMQSLEADKFEKVSAYVHDSVHFIFGGFGATIIIENANKESRAEEKKQASKTMARSRRMMTLVKEQSELLKEFKFVDAVRALPSVASTASSKPAPAQNFIPGGPTCKRFKAIKDEKKWPSFSGLSVLNLAADTALFDVLRRTDVAHLCGKAPWRADFFYTGCFYRPITERGWECLSPAVPTAMKSGSVVFWILGNLEKSLLAWPSALRKVKGQLILDFENRFRA